MKGTFTYYGTCFDIDEISKASKLERLNKLLHLSVENASTQSLIFFNEEYKDKELFNTALDFIKFNLPEIVQSLTSGLGYPVLEIEEILNRSLNLSFAAFYKEAIVNLRSALELSLVVSRFYNMTENSFSTTDDGVIPSNYQKVRHEIKKWLSSHSETPNTGVLKRVPHLQKLNNHTDWFKDFDNINGMLNDFIHTNGIKYTNIKLHGDRPPSDYPPEFNKESLEIFFNYFIKVVQQIAIISAAARPELLNEDMVYQIDVQLQGEFTGEGFWGGAISIFFDLIPEKYREYFKLFYVKAVIENKFRDEG